MDAHTDGRTQARKDRHDEADTRFSQFCETPAIKIKLLIEKLFFIHGPLFITRILNVADYKKHEND